MNALPAPVAQTKLGVFTRRPAGWAAILLILGIAAHPILSDSPRVWLAICAVGATAGIVSLRVAIISTVLLSLSVLSLGAAVAQLEHYHFPAGDITAYTTETARLAEVELIIDQPPRVLTQMSPAGRPLPPRQVTSGIVQRIKTTDGWRQSSGDILIQINPPMTELAYGQRITALGMLSQPIRADNPGGFVAHL
jgi:hypothetical protein